MGAGLPCPWQWIPSEKHTCPVAVSEEAAWPTPSTVDRGEREEREEKVKISESKFFSTFTCVQILLLLYTHI